MRRPDSTTLQYSCRTSRVLRATTLFTVAVREKARPERTARSEEHTSELQSRPHLVCRLLLEKKNRGGERRRGRARWQDHPGERRWQETIPSCRVVFFFS